MTRFLAAIGLAFALLATACGSSDFDRDDAIEVMVDEAGFSEDFATCVANRAEKRDIPWDAGEESLLDTDGEHFKAVQRILVTCQKAESAQKAKESGQKKKESGEKQTESGQKKKGGTG